MWLYSRIGGLDELMLTAPHLFLIFFFKIWYATMSNSVAPVSQHEVSHCGLQYDVIELFKTMPSFRAVY